MLIEVMLNKACQKDVNFLLIQITLKKVCRNEVDFSNLQRRKYIKTTLIFRPSKLHQKSTSKSCGNLLIFSFRRIYVI